MALFGTKTAGSVAEILSDFSSKVVQLRELAQRKKDETDATLDEIKVLQTKAAESLDESAKAEKAASKIESFLAD